MTYDKISGESTRNFLTFVKTTGSAYAAKGPSIRPEPKYDTFEVLLGENPSRKGTRRYLNLGLSFQFYAICEIMRT